MSAKYPLCECVPDEKVYPDSTLKAWCYKSPTELSTILVSHFGIVKIIPHKVTDCNFCPQCGRKAGDIADLIEQEKSDV